MQSVAGARTLPVPSGKARWMLGPDTCLAQMQLMSWPEPVTGAGCCVATLWAFSMDGMACLHDEMQPT